MPALQSITDDLLLEAVDKAKHRVVLIAPGVWPPLAEAIAAAWLRLGKEKVTAILDIDPEICRIGYGSLEGLNILQATAARVGEALGEEPGIRICVLIADDQTFIFSPTPRQLETPPGDATIVGTPQPRANGIVLDKPPETLETELGSGPDGISARTVGMESLKQEKLDKVKEDLNKNPPKSFDLSRAVNVYNAKIQFVELTMPGCRLSSDRFRETAKQLTEELLQDVLAEIPPKWQRRLGSQPHPDQVRWLILEDLLRAFGDPASKVGKMKAEVIFKDVTYDMLKDPDFRAQIREHFSYLALMEEYSAAKERPPSPLDGAG